MTTLIDLPDHVLATVFTEINQHQALALGPLHSILQSFTKDKLYKHIYIYSVRFFFNTSWEAANRHSFRFPKYLNNPTINKFTIISENTLEKYWKTMDPKQPITCFEYSPGLQYLYKKVMNNFKHVKYASISDGKSLLNWSRAEERWSWSVPRGPKSRIELESYTYLGDTRHRITNIFLPRTLFEEFSFESSVGFVNLTDLNVFFDRHSQYLADTFQFKLKRLHVHYIAYFEPVRKLHETFNTVYLKELYVAGLFDFTVLFLGSCIDDAYPNLIQLGMRQESEHDPSEQICTAKHSSVKKVVVSTSVADNVMAQRVCTLALQFPKASIHWWESLLYPESSSSKYFVIDQQAWFSPTLAPRTVWFHWFYDHRREKGSFKAVSNFKYRVLKGQKRTKEMIILKRCYSEFALGAMMSLYSNLNIWVV